VSFRYVSINSTSNNRSDKLARMKPDGINIEFPLIPLPIIEAIKLLFLPPELPENKSVSINSTSNNRSDLMKRPGAIAIASFPLIPLPIIEAI